MTVHYSDLARTAETPSPAVVAATPLAPKGLYQIVIKRVLDVLAVLAGAVVVVPVVALLALMVWLRDGRAPFYRQERLGLNGRRFTMWKLRSMVIDADEKLADYLADNEAARREWAETQKLKNDPRVTRFGRLIRKSSLDELPQLWNVLKGDMSLVGPRPMMPEQKILYPGRAYYAMRPGITGFWQISDRNDCSFSARAKFDNDYYNNLSLGTDLRILAGTFRVVLRCTGY